MIKLDIAGYCHNCPSFDPRVSYLYSDNMVRETIISCANAEVCHQIELYLGQKGLEQECLAKTAACNIQQKK